MKQKEKIQARQLREKGISVSEISKKLNVSKSSVSLWVRDIKLTDEQVKKLLSRGRSKGIVNTLNKGNTNQSIARRKEAQSRGYSLGQNNERFSILCMLYWGEGTKGKNSIDFTNTDLHMLKLFHSEMQYFFPEAAAKVSMSIHCYDDFLSVDEIENFWIESLGINKLGKTQVNKISRLSKGIRKGINKLGTVKLRYHNTENLNTIYGGIRYFGSIDDYIYL